VRVPATARAVVIANTTAHNGSVGGNFGSTDVWAFGVS